MDPKNLGNDYEEIEAMTGSPEKAASYLVAGLLTDGAHHKQWCMEQALKVLGLNLAELRKVLRDGDYDWEEGIAP